MDRDQVESILVTEASEIRAERVGSAGLFPAAGGEQMNLEGRMGINPLQYINEVDIGINAL